MSHVELNFVHFRGIWQTTLTLFSTRPIFYNNRTISENSMFLRSYGAVSKKNSQFGTISIIFVDARMGHLRAIRTFIVAGDRYFCSMQISRCFIISCVFLWLLAKGHPQCKFSLMKLMEYFT